MFGGTALKFCQMVFRMSRMEGTATQNPHKYLNFRPASPETVTGLGNPLSAWPPLWNDRNVLVILFPTAGYAVFPFGPIFLGNRAF